MLTFTAQQRLTNPELLLCRRSCFLSYTAEISHYLTAKTISKEVLFY
jgi:hypothetical protein